MLGHGGAIAWTTDMKPPRSSTRSELGHADMETTEGLLTLLSYCQTAELQVLDHGAATMKDCHRTTGGPPTPLLYPGYWRLLHWELHGMNAGAARALKATCVATQATSHTHQGSVSPPPRLTGRSTKALLLLPSCVEAYWGPCQHNCASRVRLRPGGRS